MTDELTQLDPSPCCQVVMIRFVSGGSENGTKGSYVMCHECRKEYRIFYKTGVLIDG